MKIQKLLWNDNVADNLFRQRYCGANPFSIYLYIIFILHN